MNQEQLEEKVSVLDQKWTQIDKKLEIIINSSEHINKAAAEFRGKVDRKIERLEDKVAVLENQAAVNGTILAEFKLVRDTIVKKVSGLVLVSLLSVGAISAMFIAYAAK